MSLKDVDLDAALRRLAEKRIEDAMREGKFDNLPGMGKPIELEPMPAEENARALWWAIRIMRQNDYTPEEVRWRKLVDGLRAKLDGLSDEAKLEAMVLDINRWIYKINTLGTNAMKTGIAPLDLETERAKLRVRIEGAGA